jgi:hypothetical protein
VSTLRGEPPFNELIANCVIYSNACDITDAANALAAEGHPVDTEDLATVSPYITTTPSAGSATGPSTSPRPIRPDHALGPGTARAVRYTACLSPHPALFR